MLLRLILINSKVQRVDFFAILRYNIYKKNGYGSVTDMDDQTFYPATNDVVFKAVFGSDKKVLMGFLNQVIGLSIAAPDDI